MVSETFQPSTLKPRSVYIHVPFCRHRCGYCNFSLVADRDYLIERYLDAIETEINWLGDSFELDTLFYGGGTPSHLSPDQLARLGEIVGARFRISENAEVTAECNPNDINSGQAEALRGLGVNRISLGVQSLHSEKLKRLDRSHSPEEVRSAVEQCRSFAKSVSLDMIFSAPKETLDEWKTDLAEAVALEPDHISTYELTYEKGTRFWNLRASGSLAEAEEDLRAKMYQETIDFLKANGLSQYEVSSFSKSNHRCAHNCVYWSGDPYLAFGPGASRFVDGVRETNHQSTMQYLKLVESGVSPVADCERLEPVDAAKERLAIGLRMLAGVEAAQFKVRTGFSIGAILGKLQIELVENGLLVIDKGVYRLSEQGIMVADFISAKIVDG